MTKQEALKYVNPETGLNEILSLVMRKDRMEITRELLTVAYNAIKESIRYEDDGK